MSMPILNDEEFEEATKGLRTDYSLQIARVKETLAEAISSGIENPLSEWLDAVWEGADSHTSGARRIVAMMIGVVLKEDDGAVIRKAKDADALAFLFKFQKILERVMAEPKPS
jgi:hypothetical protein